MMLELAKSLGWGAFLLYLKVWSVLIGSTRPYIGEVPSLLFWMLLEHVVLYRYFRFYRRSVDRYLGHHVALLRLEAAWHWQMALTLPDATPGPTA